MKIIKHRINTIEELISTPELFGVEIDLRTNNSQLILEHDPFSTRQVMFTDWLKFYNHGLLIINVKEDGLEKEILEVTHNFGITNFFLLDQAFPTLYKFSKNHRSLCCARVSDIESVETVLKLNVGWIWFDSHTGNWDYLQNAFKKLADFSFNTCLVSPELQRKDYMNEIEFLKNEIARLDISFDAVCTKDQSLWVNKFLI